MHTVVDPNRDQRLMIIQPDLKAGPVSRPYVSAECRLEEAVSLVEAIGGWEASHHRIDGVRLINNKTFFGMGKTAELKSAVRQLGEEITGVFINTPTLTPVQHRMLEGLFRTTVFDRFGIVLRIFQERAQTKEAKLQVELAEIPYVSMRISEGDKGGGVQGNSVGNTPIEDRRYALRRRQRQLLKELKEIRAKRKELRENRARRSAVPTVAVVGYTNAGKTTLIKALSKDVSMVPKDMLFATLDSTLHGGTLPCGLPALYVDTIGFVSDLPLELVESFTATLEDSVAAVSGMWFTC
jgi:GTP-binding protein HflX